MTYDHLEVIAPCRCGAGTVTSVCHSPDAPFAKCWFDPVAIHCDKCKEDRLSQYESIYKWEYK